MQGFPSVSEQRLNEAQAVGRIGDWEFDVATQQIQWSQQAFALFGLDPANGPPAFGTFLTYFVPEDSARLQQLVQQAVETGERFEVDSHFVTPNGKEGYLFSIGIPVRDGSGKVTKLHGIGQDITARKRTEEALRKSEEKYRDLFESSRDALMIAEPPSGRITSVNLAAVKIYGAKNKEELISLSPKELSPERQPDGRDSAEKAREMIETAIREGSHFFEWTHRRLSGEEFSAEVLLTRMERDGKVFHQAMVRDITERKKAEETLRESEEVFRSLSASSPLGIFLSDAEGRYTYVNPRCRAVFGFSMAEGFGEGWSKFVYPDDRESIMRGWLEYIKKGAGDYSSEFRIQRRDVDIRRVLVRACPLRSDSGTPMGFVGTVEDITERRRVEDALHEMNRRQRALLDNIPDMVWVKDNAGRFVAVNEALSKSYGHSSEELIGETDFAFVPPELAESYQADDNYVIESRQRQRIVEPFVDAAGNSMVIETIKTPVTNDRGEVIGIAGVARDITERIRAEETRQMQSAALEAAANAFAITDADGTILWFNSAFTALTGYTREEAFGKNQRILKSGKHDAGFYAELWRTIKAGNVWHGELINRRKDGSLYTEEMTITPVRNAAGETSHFIAIKQDVTEWKLTEKSRRHLAAIVEQSDDAIISAELDGTITSWNAAAERLFNYAAEEILGRPISVLVPRDRMGELREILEKLHSGKHVQHHETVRLKKGGIPVSVSITVSPIKDDAGRVTGISAITHDITELKRNEAALMEDAARRRIFIEQSKDGIAVLDLEGKLHEFNTSFARMLGYSPEEMSQLHVWDWDDQWTREELMERLQSTDSKGATFETVHRRKDGSCFDVEISGNGCQLGGRKYLYCVCRDITERKCADEALQESNRQLQQALEDLKAVQERVVQQERLSALGTMASGIAHDFNNSLTAILGGSELLLQRPEYLVDREKTRGYIEMMNTAAQDAGKVVNRLREFYRHREDHEFFVSVNINELVGQAIALTQPKWKAEAEAQSVSVDVHTDLQEVPPVAGSATELREMLTNLIFNAVDAMPRGGTVAIRTHRDDGYVVLEVSDTGTGMTEEIRRRCLDPFFTTKGERGTGLGLSMAYGILQRHQGTIDIETELGKGTTFIIRLPVQTAQPRSEPKAQPVDAVKHLHVLVVDDEAVVRKIVGEYLKIDGHIVEAANNGHDGLEKFRNSRFDLVLVDRAMPGMSGDQLAAAIKSAEPKVPVVMLTGFGSMMDAADEKPAGVDLVLGKPITINALRAALSKAVASVN